jgi:phosphatidylglycerol:prolipoprotein diacylglycerol transferase
MYPLVDPILLQLGPLTIRWYGLLMMAGVLSAAYVAARYVARRGEDPNNIWDMLLWVLIPGLVGARLWYVFIQSPRNDSGLGRYLSDPATILRVWEGGLHIFGGFLFGLAALLIYVRVRKLPALLYLDGIALGLPLGQAIARWANFINQELYGPPTTLPWGLRIDQEHRLAPYNDPTLYPDSTRFHPLFLYESLWNGLGFGLIFWISRRFEPRLRQGDLLLMYLIWYPLGRFCIEFLRTDSWFFPGTHFNVVHLASAALVIGGAVALYLRHRGWSPEQDVPLDAPADGDVAEPNDEPSDSSPNQGDAAAV